jgi:hypothetical protein
MRLVKVVSESEGAVEGAFQTTITEEVPVPIVRQGSFGRVEVTSPGDFLFQGDSIPVQVAQGDPIVFNATLKVSGGFSGLVTLAITGLPAGVVAGISKNPVSPNETVIVTIPSSGIPKNTGVDLGWIGTEVV